MTNQNTSDDQFYDQVIEQLARQISVLSLRIAFLEAQLVERDSDAVAS
jgi:hypothetical protein